jgi:hypothetical protein
MSSLPAELVRLIAAFAIDLETGQLSERSHLVPRIRALSLVSSAWLLPCRKVLFSQYTLGWRAKDGLRIESPHQLPRFLFLRKHPYLAACVTNFCVMDLSRCRYADVVLEAVHEVFPNVTALTIDDGGCPNFDIESRPMGFIGKLSQLDNLRLVYDFDGDYKAEIQTAFGNTHLQSLSLSVSGHNSLQMILRALADSPTARSLQIIEIDLGTSEIEYDSDDAYKYIGQTLSNFIHCTHLRLDHTRTYISEEAEGESCQSPSKKSC